MADVNSKFVQDLSQIGQATAGGGVAQDLLNEAINRGNGAAANNQILQDRQNLTPFQFGQKYPQEVQTQLDRLDQGNADLQNYMKGATRTSGQGIHDSVLDAATGFNNTIGSIGVLGLGLLNPTLGVKSNQLLNDFTAYGRSGMSPAIKRNEYLTGLQSELDNQDTAAQYEQDEPTDGKLVAGLKRFGREVLNAGARTIENPTMLKSTVYQGTGSLFAGGPIMKTLGAAGLASNVAEPLAIGLMEGGGAYNQTVTDIMGRSNEELMQSSPDFKAAVESGVDPEQAKIRIAHNAGMTAASIQGVAGAAIGKVTEVGGFEAAPLRIRPAAEVVSNLIKEPVEEAAQSLSGQVAQNLATKMQADPNQSLIEGAGDQVALGAIGGLGSAAVAQAPSLALKTAGSGLKYVANTLKTRGEKILQARAAGSTVSDENVAPAVAAATEQAPDVANSLRSVAQEHAGTDDKSQAWINNVEQASQLKGEDLQGLPQHLLAPLAEIQQTTGKTPDVFQALGSMAAVANDEQAPQEDRTAAAAFILKTTEGNKKLFTEDFPSFMDNVAHDREEFQKFQQYAGTLQDIAETPQIKQAIQWAREKMQMPEQDLTGVDLNAPEGQQIVKNLVNVAQVAPQAVNPEVAQQVLLQADEGTLELPPEQRRVIRGAMSLLNSARLYEARNRAPEPGMLDADVQDLKAELDTTADRDNLMDFVSRQIETEGGTKAHQTSLRDHVAGINQAVAQGDMVTARSKTQRLAMFARSMRNKVEALNTSIANGDGQSVPYRALGPDNQFLPADGYHKVGVRVGNDGSERFARKVHAEATATAELANDFARQYPEFGIPDVQVPALKLDRINKQNPAVKDVNRGSSTPAAVTASPATTLETTDKAKVELPLPPAQPTRETVTAAPADGTGTAESTGKVEKTSSEPAPVIEEPVAETVEAEPVAQPEKSADVEPAVEPEVAPVETAAETTVSEETRQSDRRIVDLVEATKDDGPELQMSEVFPNLVQPNGRNRFHEAFRLPKTITSRMLQLTQPMREFYRMLGNPRSMSEFMDGANLDKITADDRSAFQRLMVLGNTALNHMYERLDAKMAKDNLLAKIEAGEEVTRYRDLRVLNLLDKGGKDYDPQLIQSAVIASLDWALNLADRSAPLTVADVADLMGIDDADVTADLVTRFNRGTSLDIAKRSLAEQIKKFWGVEANRDAKEDFTRGIPEAVAAELLHGLHSAGLIELGMEKFPGLTEKTFGRVWFDTRPKDVNKLVRSLDGAHELLSDMALKDKQVESYSIGQPVTDVDGSQLRNPSVKTTAQQKQALENVQKTPYLPNHSVFDFVQALGEETFVSLLSGRTFKDGDLDKTHDEMGLNKAHWESVKGLQRQLSNSFRNVTKQMAAVKRVGENAPTFYKHHLNKLGRLQMAGLSNPQADKLAREIFMATGTKLNLNDRADFLKFLATVGQGIGLKTEKETRQAIANKVVASTLTTGGELRPLVQELKTWLDKRGSMPSSTVDLLQKAGLSMHGIHSLLAIARYENAKDRGQDVSAFETANYLEADGKTNGPINALMLWATGRITSDWLKQVGKGGVFFGRKGKTLNSHEDKVDLYEDSSTQTELNLVDLDATLIEAPEAHALFQSFKQFLAALDTNVTIDENNQITIKRGLTKNPLTITIYGSGENGIAGKITDELVGTIYEKLSQSMADQVPVGDLIYGEGKAASFMSDLAELTSRQVRKSREKGYFVAGETKQISGTAKDFALSSQQYKALQNNVKMLLVSQLRDAIADKVTRHVDTTTGAIQQATQLQSIMLKGMFIQEITARLALMKSDPAKYDYNKGEFLSQAELDDILKNLRVYAPVIDTKSQGYFLSGGEKSDLFDKTTIQVGDEKIEIQMPDSFARSLTSDLSSPAYVYGPTLAGVSAIPTLTVGSGDGQMMLNFLAQNPEAAARVLHVFDGLNMPADAIEDYSRGVNEAVFKTWTGNTNPVRAVEESFAEFLRNAPVEALFPGGALNEAQNQALKEISQAKAGKFDLKPEELLTPEQAKEYMGEILGQLNDAADQTDARRQVYSEFDLSVDQMASAESPFTNEGKIQLDPEADLDTIEKAMNARYEELLNESQANQNAETAIEQGDVEITQAVAEIGAATETGARLLYGHDLKPLFASIYAKLSPTQREMMRAAVKLLEKSDYRMVLGDGAAVKAWEAVYNADRYSPDEKDYYGKIDPISKIIVIKNVSAETIVHELVHAATFDKVNAYYSDPTLLTKEERDAITRLEGLMDEWMRLDYFGENSPGYMARELAERAIRKHQRNGRDAEALNEFMAWVLGNQHLADFAQKTKVKNPFFRVIGDTLRALKTLLWGGENKGPRVGDSILSNLRFNTRVLMATPGRVEILKKDFATTALYQSAYFGSNDRLRAIRQRLNQKVVAWMKEGGQDLAGHHQRLVRSREVDEAKQSGLDVATSFAAYFPDLGNMQAWTTFTMIQATLATEVELNPNALSRMEEIYTHVIKNLKVSDFRQNEDPQDTADAYQAQQKFDALNGLFVLKTDKHGRSSLMSSFISLAMTSEEFRKVLVNMKKPEAIKDSAKTLDAVIDNLGNAGMDRLSLALSGEKRNDTNVRDALDSLMLSMIENVGDQRTAIERTSESGLDRLNDYVATAAQNLSEKVAVKSRQVVQTSNSKVVRTGARLANLAATMINESRANDAAMGVVSWLNRREGLNPLKELAADVIGRTKDNAPIWDMISKVRAEVQQTRQQFRDLLPEKLASAFVGHVTSHQWTALYKVLGKTDLASLYGRFGVTGALDLVSSEARRQAEIQTLENAYDRRFQEKAKQLAHFMITGEHGVKLLRNAHAIAAFSVDGVRNLTPAQSMVDDIDRLVSLYAIEQTDRNSRDAVVDLIRNQKNGVEFVTNYLVGQRTDELAKARSTTAALFNHYKGHIPSEAQQGGSLIIASDSEHAHLTGRGYKRLSAYNGSSADRVLGRRSYYFAPVSGRAPFTQGVLQTVHQTASGVDPETGYTTGEILAGRIDDAQVVRLIERQLANQSATSENLLPVYDNAGKIFAFERAADPAKLTGLNRSTDLSQMIGVWRGRQVEELLAKQVNEELVDTLKSMWEEGKRNGRRNEFVNIAKLDPQSDDRILIEAVRLIPKQSRDYIKQTFGPDQFWVRRDMLLDTFGARQASVGDLFSGHTRWNPKVAGEFEKLAAGMLGSNAYSILVGAEKNIQSVVSNAKTLIVVKSVIVPAANMISNMFQLLNHGVPLRDVLKGVPAKTAEINAYIKRRGREIAAEAELRAAKGNNNLVAIRKLETEIRSLQDSYRRMSIWPLIEEGEFSAISNGQVTAEDLAIADGKWQSFVERKVNSLPDGLRTPARYALVTRDTALFQGLARSVQYGDFVGKAIMYDHLRGRKKVAKHEAIAQVSEAFINYNKLAGRGRQYLESVGLLWFYNYKLRIMKEAAYMLRHNPLRSLLMTAVPSFPLIGDIGTPVADNVLAIFNDGKLGYSIGPNMGLHAFGLNPWINLTR
ncbi:hypothetical protein X766_15830 [Mesorhizobium sp. LSJC255A00]|uniref:hypothetical protein n=1 Tax=Mesorhizobium sp. LSJC255A00 TaxID=1287313 RepID=UPI0003CF0E78|nr:hypothetical protein [Mesorhizobium sp. LSJC255A00]ESX17870.1 hypothetical protein X766_15830 [Mesorhizobium sp. LSJC255A00]